MSTTAIPFDTSRGSKDLSQLHNVPSCHNRLQVSVLAFNLQNIVAFVAVCPPILWVHLSTTWISSLPPVSSSLLS